jgi:hypothetical protein
MPAAPKTCVRSLGWSREDPPVLPMFRAPLGTMTHNGSQVGDVALSPTGAKGHVAERRAAAPRSPRRLPRRRCAYVLLSDVALLSVPAFVSVDQN